MVTATVATTMARSDPTAAERQRRHRESKRQAAVVTRDSTVPAVTLFAALSLAGVSAAFSIVGLTSIFQGSFWPIVCMGVALELGKLSAVSWCARRYGAPRVLRVAIAALIVTLMLVNTIGCYGYLAANHITAAVAAELPIAARAADLAAKTVLQEDALADVDKRIAQIDTAVDVSTRRHPTSALALAAEQATRRKELVAERIRAANVLASLQIQAAQVEGARATAKADSGPVHLLVAAARRRRRNRHAVVHPRDRAAARPIGLRVAARCRAGAPCVTSAGSSLGKSSTATTARASRS
jgi:hypothetical protein